ncbi:O-Methyltransferase involved in polyketide biosynthesis [Pseudonocardia sp. Ae168_Ps1]|uniref:SAM-dependent methyltransferase n=1 Tax=unclassified Pseudonocardia TaxID=2619320 RepID=UPI0001FFEF47|nr:MULTISPECIES: SAM-dependent methyltransferase [unclassified Pseudonocardia]ALL77786.1 hypothetical protein AD006_25240 [Pseudonocardia sp. EC080610-09]ALL80701.1 hypothetical protein AD017_04830 [Pseudonocardia sp. EC080619-01]OLL76845.1 O-Methyltransferase involved in polyketide biosynthesis [Pseudonocardia sp. Ae150A_Ps1]OLL82859.1 O-Methyltransferase involved in polyketide biosynthesis [Pseudonocardia sp. Ae168_Ps1]OLL83029.1 O-Methyltransferase involved in polyketide biosynthesis [Pseud
MTMSDDVLSAVSGVGNTAVFIAALRAAGLGHPDRLIESDPIAEAVTAAVGDAPVSRLWRAADGSPSVLADALRDYVAMRTRYFDERVHSAVDEGVRQIVVLGAGLDGRAHRMRLPDATIFEIDAPEVLRAKRLLAESRNLTPTTYAVPVPTDLRDGDWPDALQAAGYDRDLPALWLAEGLLFYLAPEDCAALLAAVGALSAPGSAFATEYPQGDLAGALDDIDGGAATRDMIAAFVQAGPQLPPQQWFAGAGWSATARDVADWARALGRTPPDWSTWDTFTWWFATADPGPGR